MIMAWQDSKDARLRMDTDIRIPVTAEQKQIISAAVRHEPGGLAAWARGILLREGEKRQKRSRN